MNKPFDRMSAIDAVPFNVCDRGRGGVSRPFRSRGFPFFAAKVRAGGPEEPLLTFLFFTLRHVGLEESFPTCFPFGKVWCRAGRVASCL